MAELHRVSTPKFVARNIARNVAPRIRGFIVVLRVCAQLLKKIDSIFKARNYIQTLSSNYF